MTIDTAAGIITSVVTKRSVKELDLKIDSEIAAIIKATKASVAKR